MAEIFDFHVQDDRSILIPQNRHLEPIMQEDHKVATWRFRIPKVLNQIDMSGWSWWFVYVNAKGQEYSELLTLTDDIDEPASYSTADYDIDYGISKFPGSFSFALEAINTSQGGEISGEWHTRTYSHKVDKTLQGNQAEYAETESDIISALMQEVRNKVNQLVGGATPLPVNLKSLMTDHDKVYLYTGSEPNESTGYWYYWNGTNFVPGGVYGAGDPESVQGYVEDWLNDHPEATTTVQDGSITEPKLADALKLKTVNDYVTPEMYGAKGDGVTDDTLALQAMFDEIASIKATKNITCFGKGRYKTNTITIGGDRYSDAYSAQIIGLTFVCNNTLVFAGESNHYNYTFESCSFFANVNNAVLFNNYVFSHTSFENCYFYGFKHIIYSDVFIQMMKFDRCTFEGCTNVFDFTAVYTMYIDNCIFTGCDHVFTQELLNGDVSTSLRNIQRLIVNKCTFENYTDYAARLVCFSEVVFTNNYFNNGQGNGHGIIIASDADYTRGRHVLVVENNNVQMAISSSVSPKLLIFENTDIDCGTITDNYSYNTYIADLSNLTVNKKLIYKRNTREGDTQTFLFTPYRFTNMVLDENLPARQIGSINGAVYYFKMIKGKAIIYRSVNTGTVSVGDIKKITFNFTNNTTVDLSQISPFDLNNNAKNMGCYSNNGTVTLFEMVLSSDYDSANNPIGFAVN